MSNPSSIFLPTKANLGRNVFAQLETLATTAKWWDALETKDCIAHAYTPAPNIIATLPQPHLSPSFISSFRPLWSLAWPGNILKKRDLLFLLLKCAFCYLHERFGTFGTTLIPEKNSNNNMSHGPIKKKIRGMIRFRFLRCLHVLILLQL